MAQNAKFFVKMSFKHAPVVVFLVFYFCLQAQAYFLQYTALSVTRVLYGTYKCQDFPLTRCRMQQVLTAITSESNRQKPGSTTHQMVSVQIKAIT